MLKLTIIKNVIIKDVKEIFKEFKEKNLRVNKSREKI